VFKIARFGLEFEHSMQGFVTCSDRRPIKKVSNVFLRERQQNRIVSLFR